MSDVAVAATWEELQKTGAESLVTPAERQRAELAAERKPLILALRQIPSGIPADQRDKAVLKIWKPDVLDNCADVWPWKTAYAEAVSRYKVLKKVRTALVSGDDLAAVQGLGNKLLTNFPLPNDWNDKVKAAKTSAGTAQRSSLRFRPTTSAASSPHSRPPRSAAAPISSCRTARRSTAGSKICSPRTARRKCRGTIGREFTSRLTALSCAGPGPTCGSPISAASASATTKTSALRADAEPARLRTGRRPAAAAGRRNWAGAAVAVQAELDAGFAVFTSPVLVLGRLGRGKMLAK